MKVFAYLRVSTKEQTEAGGYERQLTTVEKFCDDNKHRIARVFRDQQSGGDEFADRSSLHELLSLAGPDSATGVTAIVVERADRIARDLMVQEIFLRECRNKHIEVYAADSGEELVLAGADPTRVLIRQILGALAQWEKSQIIAKLQAGRRKKARETGAPCGGPKPYGQTESERVMIHEIYTLRRRGQTFLSIANSLTERGIPTPDGTGHYWLSSTAYRIYAREAHRRALEKTEKFLAKL